ncbi:hypothetical protein ACLOJK_020901 [Asimina triloba]
MGGLEKERVAVDAAAVAAAGERGGTGEGKRRGGDAQCKGGEVAGDKEAEKGKAATAAAEDEEEEGGGGCTDNGNEAAEAAGADCTSAKEEAGEEGLAAAAAADIEDRPWKEDGPIPCIYSRVERHPSLSLSLKKTVFWELRVAGVL